MFKWFLISCSNKLVHVRTNSIELEYFFSTESFLAALASQNQARLFLLKPLVVHRGFAKGTLMILSTLFVSICFKCETLITIMEGILQSSLRYCTWLWVLFCLAKRETMYVRLSARFQWVNCGKSSMLIASVWTVGSRPSFVPSLLAVAS